MLQTRNGKRTGDGGAEVLDRHGQGEADRLEDGGDAQSRPISSISCSRRSSIATEVAKAQGDRHRPAGRPRRRLRPDLSQRRPRRRRPPSKGEKVLLVRIETSPEDLRGMIAAEGILTARGGVSSHAALVARQMGKVCVCGAAALEVDYQARTRHGRRPDLQGRRLAVDRRHGRQGLRRPGQDGAVGDRRRPDRRRRGGEEDREVQELPAADEVVLDRRRA